MQGNADPLFYSPFMPAAIEVVGHLLAHPNERLPKPTGASVDGTAVAKGGTTAVYTVTVTRLNGFSAAVSLSVSGLPTGTTGAFSPNPATGTTSTLTLSVGTATAKGTFTFTVTGTGGTPTLTRTATPTKTPTLTPTKTATPRPPAGARVNMNANLFPSVNPTLLRAGDIMKAQSIRSDPAVPVAEVALGGGRHPVSDVVERGPRLVLRLQVAHCRRCCR